MAGVLVFGEIAGGALTPVSFELAAAGAQLAAALGEPLSGALIGGDLAAAGAQFNAGLATLYRVSGAAYAAYNAPAYLAAAEAIIKQAAPSIVLLPHNLQTREWAPQLAARLDAGVVLDCTSLKVEDGQLVVIKPVYGGNVLGEYVIRSAIRLATVRAGAHEPLAASDNQQSVELDVPAPAAGPITFVSESAATASGGPKLKDAKIIVSGGRGIGGPENWHYIEKTSAAVGGAVGCSRPVADSGWVSSSHQVGLSGTTVTPDLYIAVGISGAVQHLAGITSARTVVAINITSEADIFTRANYGVIGDYREVLPAFIERVKQLRPQ